MKKNKKLNISCFGEILWDVFPNKKKIGGAPFNVAMRLNSFQNNVHMISRIGDDIDGKVILNTLQINNLDISNIQIDELYKTGEVKVILNVKGSASYDIKFPSAWDKIELTEELHELVLNSDAFVFGSLVARDNISKGTLLELLNTTSYKVFDVNLRPPYYTQELLILLMKKADFIKFNDDELYEVAEYMGSNYHSLEQNLKYVSDKTGTKHICVTKGRHGAILLYNKKLYYNSGYKVQVQDTVGAGDSFLASLIHELLHGVEPQKSIDFACAVGALVAQKEGANPIIALEEIENFINP